MVDVTIAVANEELTLIEGRLRRFMHTLAGDMTSGAETSKVQTATATRSFLSRLLIQLEDHQARLNELVRQEKLARAQRKGS